MITQETLIVHKYAYAFLTIFQAKLSLERCNQLERLYRFLEANPSCLSIILIPKLTHEEKKLLFNKLFTAFNLETILTPLAELLIQHNRIIYLHAIIKEIPHLYKKRIHVTDFTISSSHAIDQETAQTLKKFLEKKSQSTVTITHAVDTTLIAGIRMQAETFLWEYSIRQQLQKIARHSSIY